MISAPPRLARKAASGWRVLALRAAIAFALLIATFVILWIERAGLKDQVDGNMSLTDLVYFTIITVTTIRYGDIIPVTDQARLVDAFLITPIRLAFWLIFIGTAFDLLVKQSWERFRMRQIQNNLSGHIVVAGFGRTGSKAVADLIARGTDPAAIVVIDCKHDAVERAKALGVAAMQGDASDNEELSAVNIDRAAALIVAAGRDDSAILIILSARALTASLPISASIISADNEDIARHAGAGTVVNPMQVVASLLVDSVKPGATV